MKDLIKIFFCLFVMGPVICGCNEHRKHEHSMEGMSMQHTGMSMKKDTSFCIDNDLSLLLTPTNEFILSSIPTTTAEREQLTPDISAFGSVGYDMRQVGVISARVSGRIDRLYIKYRYQIVHKGDRIMDIYSPELMTAEENLLFLLKNDPANTKLIEDTKGRLILLGISDEQLQQLISTHKVINTVAVYSNYSGHIHESGRVGSMDNRTIAMKEDGTVTTEPLSVKEGMYVQKGQEVFSIYDPNKAWILLSIYPEYEKAIKVGNRVRVSSETNPNDGFNGKIDFIEPFYRETSKTLTARVYFDNLKLKLPVGSFVRGTIRLNGQSAMMLPASSVMSLGVDKVVFRKVSGGFKAQKVETGTTYNGRTIILSGLSAHDSVAVNAQFLMDSESFIKTDKQ